MGRRREQETRAASNREGDRMQRIKATARESNAGNQRIAGTSLSAAGASEQQRGQPRKDEVGNSREAPRTDDADISCASLFTPPKPPTGPSPAIIPSPATPASASARPPRLNGQLRCAIPRTSAPPPPPTCLCHRAQPWHPRLPPRS